MFVDSDFCVWKQYSNTKGPIHYNPAFQAMQGLIQIRKVLTDL